jgi:hypothetical protein
MLMPRKTTRKSRTCRAFAAGLAASWALALLAAPVDSAHAGGTVADQVGLTDLIERLGAGNQPTGAGVFVSQTEAPESPGNAYPNTAHPAFAGKTFTPMSGGLGISAHATLVGQTFYGMPVGEQPGSIAPGIPQIFMYEATHWMQNGYLRTNAGANPPLTPPAGLHIHNNSWIGSFGSASIDNNGLRRADFASDRDNMLMINGVANPPTLQQPFMTFMYDGISVGLSGGGHVSTDTVAPWDGPGRQKPEIVAPGSLTSFATPIVSAAAALMYETAQTWPGLSSNANARKIETLKAVLLAGANHRAGWTNNPATSGPNRGVTSTPLDHVYGVDLVNVDRSHMILTGMEHNGSPTLPTSNNADASGWDFASVPVKSALFYRFSVSQTAAQVSILATWHRNVAVNFLSFALSDISLELKRIDASGAAVSLVGNAGLPYFTGGNVRSQSAVDNLEHLFITGLAPGTYVIELRRLDGVGGNQDVALAWLMPSQQQPGDVDGDGVVDVDDLVAVILAWGACPAPPASCAADFDGDGSVEVDDLIAVILNWS